MIWLTALPSTGTTLSALLGLVMKETAAGAWQKPWSVDALAVRWTFRLSISIWTPSSLGARRKWLSTKLGRSVCRSVWSAGCSDSCSYRSFRSAKESRMLYSSPAACNRRENITLMRDCERPIGYLWCITTWSGLVCRYQIGTSATLLI